jgi:hypothetical protein
VERPFHRSSSRAAGPSLPPFTPPTKPTTMAMTTSTVAVRWAKPPRRHGSFLPHRQLMGGITQRTLAEMVTLAFA